MTFNLAAWARRVTRQAAAATPTGTQALSAPQQALFYAAAVGLSEVNETHTVAARRLDDAVQSLAELERELEQLCLRFCAKRRCTPAVPLFLLVQVMVNIKDGFGANAALWLPYVTARLKGARSAAALIDLAEGIHVDLLRKMPQGRRRGRP